MQRQNTYYVVVSVIILLGYCITLSGCSTDNNSAAFSGRLIDVEGKPISKHVVILYPVEMLEAGSAIYEPLPTKVTSKNTLTDQTDKNGYFKIKGRFNPNMIRIGLIPPKVLNKIRKHDFKEYDLKIEYSVISVNIGELTFYGDRSSSDSTTFSIQTERKIQNAVITARPEMWIEGKIVFADKKPLADVPVTFKIQSQQQDKDRGSSYGDRIHNMDAKGNFLLDLSFHSEPKLYMVSVEYQELSATSKEFLIRGGERYDGLILKLNGDSTDIPDIPKPPEPVYFPGRIQIPTKLSPEQWIVNPVNGHAYARVLCESFEAAKAQAKSESAYLATINDKTEQKWLSSVFGYRLYWIGLHRHETENKWMWENGEQLTYTNWGPTNRFSTDFLSEGEKRAGVMTFVDGEWHAIAPGDLFWDVTKMAIFEKDDASIGTPSEDK